LSNPDMIFYLNNFINWYRMRTGLYRIFKEVSIMAYVINDSCISCGSCAGECPVGAISEGEGQFVIDADTCIDCGACASTCPVEAIEG